MPTLMRHSVILLCCLFLSTASGIRMHASSIIPTVLSGNTNTNTQTPATRRISAYVQSQASGKQSVSLREGVLDPNSAAHIAFNDSRMTNGWAQLTLTTLSNTNTSISDSQSAYAAGYLEAVATWKITWEYFQNAFASDPMDNTTTDFVKTNLIWMEAMVSSQQNDPYWYQVGLILDQYQGFCDGYAATAPSQNALTPIDILLINLAADIDDITNAVNRVVDPPLSVGQKTRQGRKPKSGGHDRCTGIIKLLPNNTDIYLGQTAWDSFSSMTRIFKRYVMPFRSHAQSADVVPGATAVFSSYPGTLYSSDDFYLLSSNLAAISTTLDNYNQTSWSYVQTDTASEWIRNLVANRLATDAPSWVSTFKQYNSGTGNNQWVILDYNQFQPGVGVKDGALYILEQMPGFIQSNDITSLFVQQGYWASYNTPYDPALVSYAMWPQFVTEFGDWFTFAHTPRANIIRRDQVNVTDVASFQYLLRYNDFQHDPLSRCNCTPPYSGENAVAARSDLNPQNGTWPFVDLSYRCHGGYDSKITTYKWMQSLSAIAIAGPTSQGQPVFQWSTSSCASEPHVGHPDRWDFDWVPFFFQPQTSKIAQK